MFGTEFVFLSTFVIRVSPIFRLVPPEVIKWRFAGCLRQYEDTRRRQYLLGIESIQFAATETICFS
jgi:hypothetical protein